LYGPSLLFSQASFHMRLLTDIVSHCTRGGAQPDAIEPSKLSQPASAFRRAASDASRFLAASASRSALSRAMVRSAERRSFRLCFDDACFDDSCFAAVMTWPSYRSMVTLKCIAKGPSLAAAVAGKTAEPICRIRARRGSRQDWPEYCLFILPWFPPRLLTLPLV
jgi:hypothetical protein